MQPGEEQIVVDALRDTICERLPQRAEPVAALNA
jgi:hypothetical protein